MKTNKTEKPTHTPGPWSVTNGWVSGHDGSVVAADINLNPADARLIAAAPDLLDALKEANEALKASGLGSFGGDIYGRIAAAIAKATEQGGR